MPPTPDTSCQCTQWPSARCHWPMTQEDLLCDTCRRGCALLTDPNYVPTRRHIYLTVGLPAGTIREGVTVEVVVQGEWPGG